MLVIVSVVRDFEIYQRLVRGNRFNCGAQFYPVDNRERNEAVPVCYNRFLEHYDYSQEAWFVFCHEDWEIQEDWQKRLGELDTESLYGPVGVRVVGRKRIVLGQIKNSMKDGSDCRLVGNAFKTGGVLGTFDCQCVIVHSSLIQRTGLRFDPHLAFDFYVEEFCMQARETFGVLSRVLALRCQHYSFGNLQPRFHKAVDYVRQKYPRLKRCYSTTATKVLMGPTNRLEIFFVEKELRHIVFMRHVYYSKITRSNHQIVKIFKIPVRHRKCAPGEYDVFCDKN
jgi:hypothetical protein